MENIRLKIIKLFNEHGHPIYLGLIEDIAELFYSHQGDLEEELGRQYDQLDEYRREVAALQATNAELFDTLLEASTRYADSVVLAAQQHTAEMRFKEKESREKEITGDKYNDT